MRVRYAIRARQGVDVPVSSSTVALTINKAVVNWHVTEGGYLEFVSIEFTGVDIRYNDSGEIMPTCPILEEEAYRIANYVANRVFLQTSCDAIDPCQVLLNAPETSPESAIEERKLEAARTRRSVGFETSWAIYRQFDPANYRVGYEHSAAHGYFADALRTASYFQRLELLYKVIEYFFSEEAEALDAAVSNYVKTWDAAYTICRVKDLRQLRNRSIHPRAKKKGHVTQQSIAHVKEVYAKLPLMQRLVELLLAHPTF